MALPKRRHSTSRKGKRRSAIALDLPTLVACPACGQKKQPHLVCLACGQYKGVEVIDVIGEKEAKRKKRPKS
ncbi:MAG TPA: 50S ribosomal protein L32 [Candidatus Bathyarchaeia archaeon]|nr:50S ribosomal protein L32 [Candidatus Bathyarchaeia archaeon]